ncbi:hypothetical protein D3C84_620150 [compost metagenome]
MQLVLEKSLAQCLLHLALASLSSLPTWEAHQTHDFVDVRDHALDHNRRLGRLNLVKQLCQRCLTTILVLFWRNFLLGLPGLLGDLQQSFEEVDAIDLSGFEAIFQRIEPFR